MIRSTEIFREHALRTAEENKVENKNITIGYIVAMIGIILATIPSAQAGLMTKDLNSGLTPTDLVNKLLGTGVEVSNVQYHGVNHAAGIFSGGSGIIGFDDGIILSTGKMSDVIGPNKADSTTTANGQPGDSNLDSLIPGYKTFDRAALEFDFIPNTNILTFDYVFGSEEYNEWVYSPYNNVFGFFLNGKNVAIIPGTTNTPVSINNVNGGNPYGSSNAKNKEYFRNNDLDDGGGSIDTELDGLTVVLKVTANVNPGVINHIKLAIADAGDNVLDSDVFIRSGSFASPQSSTFGGSESNPNIPFSYEPVNLGTGNYIYQYQDLFIPGRGLPLTITRSYNSMDSNSGPFGSSWTFNYNINLAITAGSGNVIVTREDGRTDTFNINPDGSYSPPLGVYDTLAKNPDGTYTLHKKDQVKYSFTSQGKLNSITDKNGNQINLVYSGNYLTNVTDASGRELNFAYDGAGRITAITDPIGRVWSYAYDDKGNLVQYTNPLGGQFNYTYNEKHWMTSITDPRGNHIMTNTYDADGRVISQSNALGAVTNFSYDAANRTSTVTDPLGRKKIYTYNDHFWELNETDALGNTTSYAYDGNGNRISAIDANGHTTQYIYDANGNIIKIIDPLDNSIALTYDSKNNLIGGTDALGHKTIFEYEANSNPVKITNALGYATTFTYDQYGQLIGSKDANGNAISFVYDDYGNPIGITDALGNTVTFSYDIVGRLLNTTDAKGSTSALSYDALNRLTSITDPSGHTANYRYDGIGNKISFTDASGYTTFYSYNPLNQLAKVTDPMSGTVSYNYDTVDNLVAMTDANGHTTNYAYDPLNRLISITDPLGYITSYAYDPTGNRISIKDNNGNTTRFTYDALNRLTGISYQDSTSVGYVYDAIGNRMAMIDSSGTTSYVYDGLNRLTSVANSNGQMVKYGYDPAGNRIQMTYPDDRIVSYSYDGGSRLVGVTDWNGSITNYAYDVNNNLAGISYPNGMKAEYSYDKDDRLIKLVNKNQTQIISSFGYTLDAVGNRLKSEEMFSGRFESQTLTTAYDYDKLYRLIKVTYPFDGNVSYNYDPMGNRIKMITNSNGSYSIINYTYDAADQLLSAGDTIYTYDNNGNLIKINRNPGIIISYSYDNSNRLINISTAFGSKRDLYNFKYDGDGNRISKTVIHGKSLKQSNYVWDVNGIIPQVLTESDGNDTTIYTNGIGIISMIDPLRGQFYYQYDGLRSVRSLSDDKGSTKAIYFYDAFGQVQKKMGSVDNDFLFAGEQMDDTGLIYLRARYYDPGVGRFITRDPFVGFASFPPSLNRYTYAYNNPVEFVDPSGKVVPLTIFVAGGTVNELFYLGHVALGDETFSLSVAGGRFVGGGVGALVFSTVLTSTGNPWAAGAAGSATSYILDITTQQTLTAIGVPGETEDPSISDLAISTGSGAVMGRIGSYVFSPNVGRNPTHLKVMLTGRQMQKEILRDTFEQAGQEVISSGYK